MSKTIQDYRNIVKILKLQLLKSREENKTLSNTLGIASESENSSYSNRLDKLKNSTKDFAKHIYLFTFFAHKCELIGITPEMVFRVADKQRDKKVSVSNLTEIMKRLKLRLDDVEISRLLGAITKSGNIFYEQYLQYMSAFQINAEKYPAKSQRNYAQICLLKFGEQAKQNNQRPQGLYRVLNMNGDGPYLSFQNFTQYCQKSTKLKDVEMVAIFVALDLQSQCQIQRQIFNREMSKIFNLLDRGVSYLDEKGDQFQAVEKNKANHEKEEQEEYDEIKLEEQTGVEAGNKKPKGKVVKKSTSQIVKGDSTKLIGQMKKEGLRVNSLIIKLLQKEDMKKLVKPYSLLDFVQIIQTLNKKCQKKKIITFFKCMDTSNNGSVSTDELIKLWLEGREISDPAEVLYKLLARHLRQIQCPDLLSRFTTLGYSGDILMNISILQQSISNLNLEEKYIKSIESYIQPKSTVQDFVNVLESGGVKKSKKLFTAMKKMEYENNNVSVKKLVPKDSHNFPKYARMQNEIEGQKKYWETIFTNQWACWDYCLQTAYKLKQFWRDHQFGPSTGDPHGYRSIVANQSQPPPGLPFEEQIVWMTFEEMLQKQGNMKDETKLFSKNLSANDIVQGKLGDCWFVSSLSIIAANDTYIKGKPIEQCKIQTENLTFGIHPLLFHEFAKYGLYVFKFYKKYQPIYVVVDDLFPVEESSSDLIFAKSPDPGLQWVAFLEKAYSKLHHAYSNMISGDISQGLCDLTNCIPIKEDIQPDAKQQMIAKLTKLSSEKQLMGCSISLPKGGRAEQPVQLDGERSGLFYAHAYSIGDVIDLKINKEQQYKLMRVRNPWGHGQWCLDWSDKPINNDPDYMKLKKYKKNLDSYYDTKIKQALKMREQPPQKYEISQDGQFIMNIEDFCSIYSSLFTGFTFREKQYICQYIIENWDTKTPSGICKAKNASEAETIKFVKDNHQYVMDISNETDVLMSLTQQDGRLYRGQKYPYKQVCNGIIILVFNLEKNERNLEKFDMEKMTVKKLKFELRRQVNFWHKFSPGKYAIIPCKLKNKILQSQFEFRVYSEETVNLKKIKGPGNEFKILPKKIKIDNPGGISSMLELLGKS